jgi:hypothetical protein
MPKELIKKYQTPSGSLQQLSSKNSYLSTNSLDINKIIKGLNKNLGMNANGSTIKSGSTQIPGAAPAASVGSEILGEAPQLLETGLQAAGLKRAETGSDLEEGTMGLMDKGAGMMLKSGNPALMGIGAGLTALTTLNKFAGTTAKKQGTTGLDTGAYSFNMNTNAGKKQTLLGT